MLKRCIAYLIDAVSLIIPLLIYYFSLDIVFGRTSNELSFFFCSFLVALIALRDVIFVNASLGKRIMGLVIVDSKGNIPKIGVLLFRSFFAWDLFLAIFSCYLFNEEKLYDYEIKFLRATVTERKKVNYLEERRKSKNLSMIIKVFMLCYLISIIVYPINHNISWILGSYSIHCTYNVALITENRLVPLICFMWITLVVLAMIFCYALYVRFGKSLPFYFTLIADYIVSVISVIFFANTFSATMLAYIIIGLTLRLVCLGVFLVFLIKGYKFTHNGEKT